MADTTIEFALFAGKHTFAPERAAVAGQTAGLLGQYTGTKMEDPSTAVHVTIWRSAAAYAVFAAAPASQPANQPAQIEVLQATETANLFAALDAPCTEIFTGYGAAADGSFLAAVRTFRDRVDLPTTAATRPAGFQAATVVQTEDLATGPTPGPAVRLLIGWTSREAHLAAKAKAGPIADNIGLLRDGRKAADLYHVQLQKV